MKNAFVGFKAGVFATLVIFVLMMIQTAAHLVPQFHVVHTLSAVLGFPGNVFVGLIALLIIGTFLWGGVYALVADRLPARKGIINGVMFGGAVWLIMMVVFMPLAGAGVFGLERGTVNVALLTLALHLIFGAVLGKLYADMENPRTATFANKKGGSIKE